MRRVGSTSAIVGDSTGIRRGFDVTAGISQGRQVSDYVFAHVFRGELIGSANQSRADHVSFSELASARAQPRTLRASSTASTAVSSRFDFCRRADRSLSPAPLVGSHIPSAELATDLGSTLPSPVGRLDNLLSEDEPGVIHQYPHPRTLTDALDAKGSVTPDNPRLGPVGVRWSRLRRIRRIQRPVVHCRSPVTRRHQCEPLIMQVCDLRLAACPEPPAAAELYVDCMIYTSLDRGTVSGRTGPEGCPRRPEPGERRPDETSDVIGSAPLAPLRSSTSPVNGFCRNAAPT
jgi:hypothetical protein